jgi:glutamate-1-semialdehyde 2,1-aminomutase
MTAGLKTLELISEDDFFIDLTMKTKSFVEGMKAAANEHNVPLATSQVGGMFGFFFTEAETVTNFQQVTACDTDRFNQFFHAMLNEGVNLAPSAFEAGFVSAAHSTDDLEATIVAAEKVFAALG